MEDKLRKELDTFLLNRVPRTMIIRDFKTMTDSIFEIIDTYIDRESRKIEV